VEKRRNVRLGGIDPSTKQLANVVESVRDVGVVLAAGFDEGLVSVAVLGSCD
jgi:hypothetical protein